MMANRTPQTAPGGTPLAGAQAAKHALDRSIKSDDQVKVSVSAFSLLFLEVCNRSRERPTQVKSTSEWEDRLAAIGANVGRRAMELQHFRDGQTKRVDRCLDIISILTYISRVLWKRWFGKESDGLERVGSDNYYIVDCDPLCVRYIGMIKEYIGEDGQPTLSLAAFHGGMIRGALVAADLPAKVTTYSTPTAEQPNLAKYYIEFEPHVLDRERRLKSKEGA
jgi:hypothetical protein